MNKKMIYSKFISAFIIWSFIFFFTKTSLFNEFANSRIADLKLIDMGFFLFIWFFLSIKYITKIIKLGEEIYIKSAKIHDFMNCLFVLILIQNITYIDIILLSKMISITNVISTIILLINICLFCVYFCKNKIRNFKKIYIIQIFVFVIFILYSSPIELLIIDISVFMYYVLYKCKINFEKINIIDKLFILFCFVGFLYFIHLLKNEIIVMNYACALIYFIYYVSSNKCVKKDSIDHI